MHNGQVVIDCMGLKIRMQRLETSKRAALLNVYACRNQNFSEESAARVVSVYLSDLGPTCVHIMMICALEGAEAWLEGTRAHHRHASLRGLGWHWKTESERGMN